MSYCACWQGVGYRGRLALDGCTWWTWPLVIHTNERHICDCQLLFHAKRDVIRNIFVYRQFFTILPKVPKPVYWFKFLNVLPSVTYLHFSWQFQSNIMDYLPFPFLINHHKTTIREKWYVLDWIYVQRCLVFHNCDHYLVVCSSCQTLICIFSW